MRLKRPNAKRRSGVGAGGAGGELTSGPMPLERERERHAVEGRKEDADREAAGHVCVQVVLSCRAALPSLRALRWVVRSLKSKGLGLRI